ncbi:MAG: hypothetical protein FWD89_00120 [Firmicutes bacterium]|nr:hypothetical protein [Bacillota bacterium]MCL2770708.1 hypothetical protein [Bacillota bacterium]
MMKNIILLHSLNADTVDLWGQDVKQKAEELGIDFLMPSFPTRAESRYEKFDAILKTYLGKELNKNTIVVCHSIGCAYFSRFMFEHKFEPFAFIGVAPGGTHHYDDGRHDYIVDVRKQSIVPDEAKRFVKNSNTKVFVIRSGEGEIKTPIQALFSHECGAEDIYLDGYGHFSSNPKTTEIPELIELIKKLL